MSSKPANAGRVRSSLSALEPIDASAFGRPSHPVFIWASLILVWLISLLPWRLWEPAPDLLLLVIAFWSLNEPRRVGMFTAFCFGLIMDVHDAGFLGEQALLYTLVAFGAACLTRRLQRFSPLAQPIHMLPIMVGAEIIVRVMHAWLAGQWAGWAWIGSVLLTVALWPLAEILLHLPKRGQDEIDSGAA